MCLFTLQQEDLFVPPYCSALQGLLDELDSLTTVEQSEDSETVSIRSCYYQISLAWI